MRSVRHQMSSNVIWPVLPGWSAFRLIGQAVAVDNLYQKGGR
jgi:hypothetical protein